MSRLVKVAKIDEMADHPAKCVEVDGQKIALFAVEGEFYAMSDTCTHRGGPLSEGELEGTEVVCPWHGARFDVKAGTVLAKEGINFPAHRRRARRPERGGCAALGR